MRHRLAGALTALLLCAAIGCAGSRPGATIEVSTGGDGRAGTFEVGASNDSTEVSIGVSGGRH